RVNKNGKPIKPAPAQAPVVEEARLSEGGQMLANRLQKNLKQLGKWARKENIDCYRVYDADIHAVAVDVFLARPLAQLLEVFLQAVGEHLPAFAQARLLDNRCLCRRRFDRLAVFVDA